MLSLLSLSLYLSLPLSLKSLSLSLPLPPSLFLLSLQVADCSWDKTIKLYTPSFITPPPPIS